MPAAGSGKRFGASSNKLLVSLCGAPLLSHTVRALTASPAVREIVLVAREEEREALTAIARAALEPHTENVRMTFAKGGAERRDSVLAGLLAASMDHVLVHDGARPLLPLETLEAVLAAATRSGAALCALPATDTVKISREGREVDHTIPRDEVFLAQTPQAFRKNLIVPAYQRALAEGRPTTDDVHVLEGEGHPIEIVRGDPRNLKITHPQDLALATALMQERNTSPRTRIGLGFDLHRLVEGRPCTLGGIAIEYEKGPLGHSDGDVLLHALTDAILGAAGLDDLGTLFEDTDERWQGADSATFLSTALTKMRELGYALSNCDLVMIGERPRLAPYRTRIRTRIAELTGVPESCINVKGKSAEKLGPLGQEEAIAAQAVVLLERV